MNELMNDTERAAYRKVYEGGTHEVMCDGDRHIWRIGGKINPTEDERIIWRRGRCDCERWVGRK